MRSSEVHFLKIGGDPTRGFLAEPDTANAPGIVVIHEWWGLTDQIKGICERLADLGFRALAVDLYDGQVATDPMQAEQLMTGLNFADAASKTVVAAGRFLRVTGSAKVGLTGYCMGGAITVLGAALAGAEFQAAVSYYGIPPLGAYDLDAIVNPLMGHFALHDEFFTIGEVDKLDAALTAAGKSHEFHRYDANHAFCNERRPEVFDAACRDLADQRTLEFFQRLLG